MPLKKQRKKERTNRNCEFKVQSKTASHATKIAAWIGISS